MVLLLILEIYEKVKKNIDDEEEEDNIYIGNGVKIEEKVTFKQKKKCC